MSARILCIEDEQDYRESLREYLCLEGFEVIEAKDGEEGLKKLADTKPDLVLCDVNMPNMNGMDVLSRVRTGRPEIQHTPFMFLSAYDRKQSITMGRYMGADDYLVKMTSFAEIMKKVHAMLERTEERRQLQATKQAEIFVPLCAEMENALQQMSGFAELLLSQPYGALGHEKYVQYGHALYTQAHDALRQVQAGKMAWSLAQKEYRLCPLENRWQTILREVESNLRMRHSTLPHLIFSATHPQDIVQIDSYQFTHALVWLLDTVLPKTTEEGYLYVTIEGVPEKGTLTIAYEDKAGEHMPVFHSGLAFRHYLEAVLHAHGMQLEMEEIAH